jgi:hypothetical protein
VDASTVESAARMLTSRENLKEDFQKKMKGYASFKAYIMKAYIDDNKGGKPKSTVNDKAAQGSDMGDIMEAK